MKRQVTLVAAMMLTLTPHQVDAVDVEQLPDLTGGAIPLVTFERHDTFSNEFIYSVKIKNQTGDPLVASSLVIVLDRVIDLSGKDALERIEVLGQDGYTSDGKPYFRIPMGRLPELAPYRESQHVTVRFRNPDYMPFLAPSFRVRGLRLTAAKALQELIQELRKKGLLSEEETQKALEPLHRPSP